MNNLAPALGVNLKDYNPKDILEGKKWRITEKIDGVRRLFYKKPNCQVVAFSRTEKEDKWLDHITNWLTQPHFPENMVYDCELVDRDTYFSDQESFILRTETNSKASQEYPDNKGDLMALCFDIFNPDGDTRTGHERTQMLQEIFFGNELTEPMILIPILGYIQGADEESLAKLMVQITQRKGEGLMLMDMDAFYIPGRSRHLVKVKKMQEFVGTVINFEMARLDSKIAGGIAALICEVPGCTVPVRVGSGFTHVERQNAVSDSTIGRKVEIDAFSLSKDKNGNVSLSMPIFKQFI